jgi:hypothetical protein
MLLRKKRVHKNTAAIGKLFLTIAILILIVIAIFAL